MKNPKISALQCAIVIAALAAVLCPALSGKLLLLAVACGLGLALWGRTKRGTQETPAEEAADQPSEEEPPLGDTLCIQPVQVSDPTLQDLAERCGQGDAAAMAAMADFLRTKEGGAPWADFWLLRAAIYGDAASQEAVLQRIQDTPSFLKNIPLPWQNLVPGKRRNWYTGAYSGGLLNLVGLLAFQPEQVYMLDGIGRDGFQVAWEYVDSDGPDEDGFGEEEYYNMFCLDEFYQPLPGVPMVCKVSTNDIRTIAKDEYAQMLALARRAAHPRQDLWLEFMPQ